MSCNVLHPQCWQQQRWIGAGGARNRHSGETLGGKAQIGLSRTAASQNGAYRWCSMFLRSVWL